MSTIESLFDTFVSYMPSFFTKEEDKEEVSTLEKIKSSVRDSFNHITDEMYHRLWKQASHRIAPFSHQTANSESVARIEQALKDTLIYSGKGISPAGRGRDQEIHEIMQFFLGKKSQDWISSKYAEKILYQTDEELLQGAQEEIRAILESCAEMSSKLLKEDEMIFQAFIGHIISLIPFTYPEENTPFIIPQKIDGQWKKCHYRIDRKFELTPGWFSSPMVSYGLVSSDGPPIMSFLGTTFPGGDGYLATILADFTPCMSVGHAPYLLGRQQIVDWLADKEKVRLYGISLGGAMTFQVLRHHRDKIESVEAFNPPGLYPWDWKEDYNEGPKINIYYHDNDLVPSTGFFPEGRDVTVYRLYTGNTETFRRAHIRVYSAFDHVTVLKSDPAYENKRWERKILTGCHMFFGSLFAFVPIFCGYVVYLMASKVTCLAKRHFFAQNLYPLRSA